MPNDTGLSFRPCTPKDVEIAIPLIYSSGPDAFDYVFSNGKLTALDFLRFAFISTGGEFSYDNHIAVIREGQMIGIGSAFSKVRSGSFTWYDSLNILKLYKLGALSIMSRGLRVEQIIKLPKKAEVACAHIAIDEKYRSKGYGQALMEYLMKNTKLEDKGYFVLDVSALNPRAKALYERLGFKDQKFNTSNLSNKFGTVADHFRMEKTISP